MQQEDLVAAIGSEGATLGETGANHLDAAIPRYAGWTMADLLVHTASVYRRTTDIVRESLTEPVLRVYPEDDQATSAVAWFTEALETMTGLLAEADPTVPVWGFGPSPTVGFWIRRMALETAVHRWDAQDAVGTAEMLPSELAAEGIDELEVMWLPRLEHDIPADARYISLHATDRSAWWLIEVTGAGLNLTPTDGRPDEPALQLAGPAADLHLYLVNRGHLDALEVTGDPSVAAAFTTALAATAAATR